MSTQVYFGESLWIICKMSPIIMANQELKLLDNIVLANMPSSWNKCPSCTFV